VKARASGAQPLPAPPFVREAIDLITRHLAGEPQDLRGIPLDYEQVPAFHRQVYEAAREVPSGRIVTYGELARRAGSPGAARAVGQAMARNRFPVVVPCHRVLAAGERPGGFTAFGGLRTKARLLALEGVELRRTGALFDGAGRVSFDVGAALEALRTDPPLARLIERVGPFRLKPEAMHSPYESLAEAILYQQLAGKAAAAIVGRLKGVFDGRWPSPEAMLEARDEVIRGAGVSRPKMLALKDLAAKTLDGTVPPLSEIERLDDEELVSRLVAVRGVGRWTVEMLLIFRLGRPDVLPSSDYGIRKGLARLLGRKALPTPAQVARRGERWRPWRSVASWYLWRALEL